MQFTFCIASWPFENTFSIFSFRPMGVHAAFVGHVIMRGHGLLKTMGCLRNNSYRSMTLQICFTLFIAVININISLHNLIGSFFLLFLYFQLLNANRYLSYIYMKRKFLSLLESSLIVVLQHVHW